MPGIVQNENRWKTVSGPMAATISTLVEIGWKPVAPDAWIIASGNAVARVAGTAYAKAHILVQATKDMETKLAKEAGLHEHSSGIQNTIELQAARRAKAFFIKEKRYAEAAALDFVVTGAFGDHPKCVDGERQKSEHLCHRCSKGIVATRWHQLHECDDNHSIDDPIMRKTHHIAKKAKAGWQDNACLCAGAIMPSEWATRAHDVDFGQVKVWHTNRVHEVLARTRVGYSDGTGGRKEIH